MEDYPKTREEFERRFRTDDACLRYLAEIRWPNVFACPRCGGAKTWKTQRGLLQCKECGKQTSVTAGTIFHGTRKPLHLWFRAMWHITNQKYGANALGMQRLLEFTRYETAWQWLHKLRRAMVRPSRDQMSGCLQVDETYLGGKRKPGKRGRGAEGKALVAVAVEDQGPKRIGRIRLMHIPDASAESLENFIVTMIRPGSIVKTDDWSGYSGIDALGYERKVLNSKELHLPHLVASLLKRWILGTYQGSVRHTHLAYYLDEFTFRFNRRKSASRGKLFYRLVQQAMLVDKVIGSELKAEILTTDDDSFDDLVS